MSGDFQLRKDIDRFKSFLNDLEYNMGIDITNATASINEKLDEIKASYYDQSDIQKLYYNKEEIDELINTINSRLDSLDERVTALEEAINNANQ